LTGLAAAAASVDRAIAEVKAAQQAGDFTRYGAALSGLEKAMSDFQAAQQTSSPPSTSAGQAPAPPGSAPAPVPSQPAGG
jgi:hypothetical protein